MSKKFDTEEQDLTKMDTLEACNEVFAISQDKEASADQSATMLASLVTKMPEEDQSGEIDLHRQHFEHTL